MPSIIDKIAELDNYLAEAKGIAWDTCHKTYILMSDQEMQRMKEYEYDPLISSDEMSPQEMLATVLGWYNESCSLRFISVVDTYENGDANFLEDVVPQSFEDEEDE
jgi:hypothetical protein